VAADLPVEVRSALEALQKRLKASGVDLKWVLPASMHLTVKFLGEIPLETFDAVCRALDEPLGLPGPLHLSLSGVGAFPSPRKARVVWVGLSGDIAALSRAAPALDARAERGGVAREVRPFVPHLTLARSRSPSGVSGLDGILGAEADYAGPAFDVGSFVLYESLLRPGGPIYTPRKTISLQ
jgi:2'-5' RNA ligase